MNKEKDQLKEYLQEELGNIDKMCCEKISENPTDKIKENYYLRIPRYLCNLKILEYSFKKYGKENIIPNNMDKSISIYEDIKNILNFAFNFIFEGYLDIYKSKEIVEDFQNLLLCEEFCITDKNMEEYEKEQNVVPIPLNKEILDLKECIENWNNVLILSLLNENSSKQLLGIIENFDTELFLLCTIDKNHLFILTNIEENNNFEFVLYKENSIEDLDLISTIKYYSENEEKSVEEIFELIKPSISVEFSYKGSFREIFCLLSLISLLNISINSGNNINYSDFDYNEGLIIIVKRFQERILKHYHEKLLKF